MWRTVPLQRGTLHDSSEDGELSEKSDGDKKPEAVAPGYPASEALKDIDVSGWEPAAVFQPVDLSEAGTGTKRDE